MTDGDRIDRIVAEWLGWKPIPPTDRGICWTDQDGHYFFRPPAYTTDANLANVVLAEVERRGLADDWMKELETILDVWDWKRDERFMLVTASPLDQMRALVRVIKGEGDG